MNRREMVLLGLCLAGVLYAASVYLFGVGPAIRPESIVLDRSSLEKTMAEAKGVVDTSKPSDLELYQLTMAESPFPRDPFAKPREPGETLGSSNSTAPAFVYSGFLEMSGKRFAIINGMEYLPGEELEVAGFVVSDIQRNKVILEHRGPASATTAKVVVPLQEGPNPLFKEGPGQ